MSVTPSAFRASTAALSCEKSSSQIEMSVLLKMVLNRFSLRRRVSSIPRSLVTSRAQPTVPIRLPGLVPEGCLVDIQEEELALDVPVFVEPLGLPVLQHDLIGIQADLSEGMPLGILRMAGPLPLGEEQIVLPQGFFRVPGVQELLADGLVGEEIVLVDVLGPDHVRHVVAHQPEQVAQGHRTALPLCADSAWRTCSSSQPR